MVIYKNTDAVPDGASEDYRKEVTLSEIPEDGQDILQEYSGITQSELLAHIVDIRDRGFNIAPFPCIGQVRFLKDRWKAMPYFDQFLPRLRDGAVFLDVGCCFGQELRFLIHKYGVSPAQMYGFDLDGGLVELGYDLFNDRDRLRAHLFAADVLKLEESHELGELRSGVDLIQASQALHVFDLDDMVQAAKNLVALSRTQPGSIIAGNQMGSHNPGSYEMLKSCTCTGRMYRHNEESMERFWQRVGQETGTRWKVVCKEIYSEAVVKSRNAWWADPGMFMIWFSAVRL